MANLATYGCFGDGKMLELNRAADLRKVQQWVKFEDYMELLNTSTNSAMGAICGQQLSCRFQRFADKIRCGDPAVIDCCHKQHQ